MRALIAMAGIVAALAGGVLLARGDVPCVIVSAQPVCEVAVIPGPSEDALELITIDDADVEVFPSTGRLLVTTIAVQDELDFRSWFRARTSRVIDAVPRETIFPAGADAEQVAEDNAVLMADSQLMATIAALTELGYSITGEGARVVGLADDAATDALEPGDVIVDVDGEPVTDAREAVTAVQRNDPGATVRLGVASASGTRTVPITLGTSPDGSELPYVGVLLTTEVELPVEVSIDAGPIGGPSAGLLFALSIVELLGPEDLADGRVIAGTGALERDGTVGGVGGIRQKVSGASAPSDGSAAAEVFLVPRSNLAEARRAAVERDILLIPVDSLAEALGALAELRDGREPDDAVLLAAGG